MPGRNDAEATDSAIALCDSHDQADKAIQQLQQAGFDVKNLSIIGKGHAAEDQVIGYSMPVIA